MLTTTQSAIAEDLDSFEKTSWFTSAYLIAMSSLGPVNGKLSSIFSPRACIFVSSVILAFGTLLCSWAKDFESFIAGRVVTGIGASGVFTISIIIVLELTGSKRKGIGIGLLNSGYTMGVAIGAIAAGALLDIPWWKALWWLNWRALFWVQAPIALVGGLILLLAIPHDFTAGEMVGRNTWERLRRIDYLGCISLTASLVLLLYALSSPKSIPISPIVLSIVVGVVFVLIEAYFAHDPIIPVTLLKSRGLLLTCLGTVSYMMSRWSVLFYTPTYAIAVRQWSPSIGGSLLIPTNGGFAMGGLLVGWLHIRRNGSFYLPTLVSYACFPVTLVLLATMAHRESSPVALVLVLFVCGFTTGAALNYNLAHLLHLTPKETHYVATALIATFRGFAGSFGASIGGGLFTRTLSTSLTTRFAERGLRDETLIRKLLGSPALVEQLEGVKQEIAIKGYEDALRTLWLAAAVLALGTIVVQAGVGWEGDSEKKVLEEESTRGREAGTPS
ncbi:major facilitator superfamily transporter [Lecanosticta acicola]|uniref:Major facilitator superfamily transporter n=1 Tax=Lecanosticta acicola TaxID=111012 RepID=A0AAI8YWM5_9PEZI|nr:major facilitator superfamily transporter [Lecanosticta acicola]